MLEPNEIKKIKEIIEEFFQKMTVPSKAEVKLSNFGNNASEKESTGESQVFETVDLNIKTDDPQILIGEKGQTLMETQRLLRMILNRAIKKNFYLNLDINDYKKKKIEYLKDLARDLADEVGLTKKEKILSPMSSYERRVIHLELANRQDVITESEGEGPNRRLVIKPR